MTVTSAVRFCHKESTRWLRREEERKETRKMWKRSNQNHEQRRGKGKEEGERDKKRDRDRGVSQGNRLRQENRKIRRDNLPSKETGKYTTKEEVDIGKRQG